MENTEKQMLKERLLDVAEGVHQAKDWIEADDYDLALIQLNDTLRLLQKMKTKVALEIFSKKETVM
ncbi:hypothetical protein [Otariodibacter oris]|uniref:Uncharacterized protein n=1 Tax=Otariodibacter oris TaxID=1032623 RepID=A0A420XJ19_9PAST|nr:hypothetical protein [Otariodibacter oris]QGM80687.1 hypothetical protein A6A10_04345 [Otariodibacter oris]RKR77151.1 hypothetical protein DES31_0476 [Otariodibacter oris]